MTKKLAVPLLALGLALYGCGSSSSGGTGGAGGTAGTGGTSGTGGTGGTAGTGGTGGTAGTGGAGGTAGTGGTSGTGGSGDGSAGTGGGDGAAGTGGTGDGGTDDGSTADTGSTGDTAASTVNWTMCPNDGKLPNVSAADFCAQYLKACTFDAAGGTTGAERFKDMADCMTRYAAGSAATQACTAYHLCAASQTGAAATHCPHPPEASLATPAGPCKGM